MERRKRRVHFGSTWNEEANALMRTMKTAAREVAFKEQVTPATSSTTAVNKFEPFQKEKVGSTRHLHGGVNV